MALASPKFNSDAFWQHIIALDVQFNSQRNFSSFLKILYIKRRNQLFRDLSKQDLNTFRKQYLKLRYSILSQRYRSSSEQKGKVSHARSSSDTSFLSFIYDDLVSSSDIKRVPSANLTPNDLLYDDRISCAPQSIAFCENFSFSGVYDIFDQHTDAVTCIGFANNSNSLLCAASNDGTLTILQLRPSPPTILFVLRGHKGPVTCFRWLMDLVVSCSLDATLRLWSSTNGNLLRIFKDPDNSSILTCAFHPSNNNMIVTGNSIGMLHILNLSTGIYSKNSVHQCDGPVYSMCFQSDGDLLWVGDYKGIISTYRFEMEHCKLLMINKVIIVPGCAITSLSTTLFHNDADMLLANVAASNALVLFKWDKIVGQLEFLKSFPIKHRNSKLAIKSSFCPNSAKNNLGICIVTGSEDTCIYFYTFEDKNRNRCVNKLQGHSSPVLDVCFNCDESLLVSADNKGAIIIWKREYG